MVGVSAFLTIGGLGVNRNSPSTSVCPAAGCAGDYAGSGSARGGRLTMPEFMFRNLSVKLYPAGGNPQPRSRDRTNFYPDCTPWFTYVQCVMACSDNPSVPQICGNPDTTDGYCVHNTQAECDLASRAGGFVDDGTNVIIPPGTDIGSELSRLKVSLQQKVDAV